MPQDNDNRLVSIPVPETEVSITAVEMDGDVWIALKPACQAIGVNYTSQVEKLKSKSWATVPQKGTVGLDGKLRKMIMMNRKTTMRFG